MIGLLQAGKGHNIDSLSARCGVSRRTVFRDLDVLRQASVPLKYNEEFQVYHLADTDFLPPTKFSAAEALAVLVLCHELGDVRQMPFLAPAHTAALKIESSLPAALRKQLHDQANALQIRLNHISPIADKSPVYQQLLDVIPQRRCVRIEYDSLFDRSIIHTRLSPYRLVFSGHSWYVIGRSSVHRSVRTFNLKRIQAVEPTDDVYEIPRNFSLDRYLGNAWHLIPESGPDQAIQVRFNKKVARNVAEVNWHKTQQIERNNDGTLVFSAMVKGLSEVSWWILGYGDQAEVMKPTALRKMIATHASQMLRKYENE